MTHAPVQPAAPAVSKLGGLALSFMPSTDPATPYHGLALNSTLGFHPTSVTLLGGDRSLEVQFLGANPATVIQPANRQPGDFNIAHGRDQSQWRTHIPLYGALVYQSLYPGVDLRYDGPGGQLKGTYTVAPHADPSAIRWQYQGARASLDAATGDLLLALPSGASLTELAPIAWQEIDGARVAVPARFTLDGDTAAFALGAYDAARPLVIDPTLKISTFIGGSSSDYGRGIAVDSDGSFYVIGDYYSKDFLGQDLPPVGELGMKDAIMLKFDASGENVLYGWQMGSGETDEGLSIAVNSAKEAFVLIDSGGDYPVLNAPINTAPSLGDAVLAKFNADGTNAYSTYIGFGESNLFTRHAMAFDASGALYITGESYTAYGTLHELALAKYNPATGAATKSFIAKGIYRSSHASAIAIGADGAIYLTGQTESLYAGDFPTTSDALQSQCGRKLYLGTNKDCDGDAFLLVFNPDFSVRYASYLGGSGDDEGVGIVVDKDKNVTIAGNTGSADFPVKNALQSSCPVDVSLGLCSYDGFITHLTGGGKALGYSTYIAPKADEAEVNGRVVMTDLAIDSAGNTYAYGYTNSLNVPIKNPVQDKLTYGECLVYMQRYCFNAFVTGLTPAGALSFGTQLGGAFDEWSGGIAIDKTDALYLIGYTESRDFPVSSSALQPDLAGDKDFFISKIVLSGSSGSPGQYKSFIPQIIK